MSFLDPIVISAPGTLTIKTLRIGALRLTTGVFTVSAYVMMVFDSHSGIIRWSFTTKRPSVHHDSDFRALTLTVGRELHLIFYLEGFAHQFSHRFLEPISRSSLA